MDASQMLELVKRFQENRDFISNEETVKVALVLPLLKMLGYDPASPREVRPEYSADFTAGDGKKLPDRMDFAIFDKTGSKPLMVIETKPLGTDLKAKAQQLARYIAQMPDLHFGIITDGCTYHFFGDLENPNQMDSKPFFSFALSDPDTDWSKVAKFLTGFSREVFNADTLVLDAENARYRQEMTDRLAKALRSPGDDEGFLGWITQGVYKGKRTAQVMARLADVARESIEPAILRLIGDDFLEKLKDRIQKLDGNVVPVPALPNVAIIPSSSDEESERTKRQIETTEEELAFFDAVRSICVKAGLNPDEILYRDTISYFNVSFHRPTKWFVRYFGNSKRKSLTTWVPVEEAKTLAPGFEVEAAPDSFGVSRIYIDGVAQTWAMSGLLLRSLEIMRTKADVAEVAPTVA